MDYAYRLFKNVKFFYNTLNPATLSGAIDSIVVEQPDGSYLSTPFHVRFGKYGVFNSNEKYVDITINGEEIDLKMKLGENGVAFFVEATEEDVPEYLVTSPVPGSSPTENVGAALEEGVRALREQRSRADQKRVLSECSSLSRSPSPRRSINSSAKDGSTIPIDRKQKKSLPFKASLFSQRENRSLPNLSELGDEEETNFKEDTFQIRKSMDHSQSFTEKRSLTPPPTSRRRFYERYSRDGTLLKRKKSEKKKPIVEESDSEDIASSTSSLASSEAASSNREGSNERKTSERDLIADGALSDSEVDRHRKNEPQPHGSDVTEWKWGELPKTREETEQAAKQKVIKAKQEADTKKTESSWSDWFRWPRPKPLDEQGIYLDDLVESSINDPLKIEKYLGKSSSACPSPPYDSGNVSTTSPLSTSDAENETIVVIPSPKANGTPPAITDDKTPTEEGSTLLNGMKSLNATPLVSLPQATSFPPDVMDGQQQLMHQPSQPIDIEGDQRNRQQSGRSKSPTSDIFVMSDEEGEMASTSERKRGRYIRSLRLSSEKLKKLGLRRGANEARFSITTKFQGTCWCSCHIYLYKWSERIVISDIDGTITKSDVLGHVIPAIGGQWAHAGVAELYTLIAENGYKMVYLSSRAIGQSYYTKKYLQSIAQDSKVLPDGPLLLSPTSVLMAFRKEVIDRKPEEFKIAALTDLKDCFPVKRPFYAGFGNRETDVVSYRAVNIPPERILIIDKEARVRRADAIGFETSYMSIAKDTIDYMFPPLVKLRAQRKIANLRPTSSPFKVNSDFTKPQQFSSFTHWRLQPTECGVVLDDEEMTKYEEKRKLIAELNKKNFKK